MISSARKAKPDMGVKSRSRTADSSDRPVLAVKMDYSNIYRENEELEDDLEEQLDDLHKTRYRTWVEKRQQLKAIRQQVDVIMKLREAVNARKPGESIELVSSSRPRRTRRPSTFKDKKEEKEADALDVKEMAINSKTQMRINQEREKFSSKNLFNVRRKNQETVGSTEGRLFTKRASVAVHRSNEMINFVQNEDISQKPETSTQRPSSDRPKTAYNAESKSYMQQTVSSRKGGRPQTAIGTTETKGQKISFELSPLARQPSANRCRSRRELELLSRLNFTKADETPKINEKPAWEIIKESRQKTKLQELKSQSKELQVRVEKFLNDLHHFNTKNSGNDRLTNEIIYE